MILARRSALAGYATALLSMGQISFTALEAQRELGIGQGALLDAAEKLQKRGHLLKPRRGFYVIVPPQFLSRGAPPPSWYIDSLMRHEKLPYYVGLLKAAELLGATHQAVMQFQVVTSKQLKKIRAGRSTITFYFRTDMDVIASGIEDRKTDTGAMRVSGRELTLLDLVRYPHAAGGLDHVLTVLSDLGDAIDTEKLTGLSAAFERSVTQRLGHLLDKLGHVQSASSLHEALQRKHASLTWVELEPTQTSDPDFTPEPLERDERWRVVVRRAPESDE